MVIIGNNIVNDNYRKHVIVDDRSGRKINIPVGMVGFSDGHSIKKFATYP